MAGCRLVPLFLALGLASPGSLAHAGQTQVVVDALGRSVTIPTPIHGLLASGPGCLRLITYLEADDLVVAVDDMETRRQRFAARPYALAHPHLRVLPEFGEFRGRDNPERILTLATRPDVMFKTYAGLMGLAPDDVTARTGLPVVTLDHGDLASRWPTLRATLTDLGHWLDREARAAAVVAFLEATMADLRRRAAGAPGLAGRRVFLGGVAFKGPRGLTSTEPDYPPFRLLGLDAGLVPRDVAAGSPQATVSREALVAWDPEVIFLDLATIQLGDDQDGLAQLRDDPAYRGLTAVREGQVHGVLPYNWYSANLGSLLANAYFVGKVLAPEQFADIDPAVQADLIYEAMVGAPVFAPMNESFEGLVFQPLTVR